MKLRRLPEDFRVTEVASIRCDGGPFALYQLSKTSIGTPEAISALCRRWKVHRRQVSYGGLKDRHAVTTQYLTIRNGPHRGHDQQNFSVRYLGQTSQPFNAGSFDGNEFTLVLRDMTDEEVRRLTGGVAQVVSTGLPNYFDDQRFGSLGRSGEWIARSWCLGDYERALWLALADPHEHDSSSEKKQKKILRELWGQWPDCQKALDRSHRRSIVTYLSDKVNAGKPPDFRGALARINVDLRGLYLSAWQSALWNRLLSRLLQLKTDAENVVWCRFASGPAVFPNGLSESQANELHATMLPLPSARIDLPEGEVGALLSEVLSEEGVELRQVRVKYPRDTFFSRGQRSALVRPTELKYAVDTDELYPRRQKVTLAFRLPKGSYATILVKRLTEAAADLCSGDTAKGD